MKMSDFVILQDENGFSPLADEAKDIQEELYEYQPLDRLRREVRLLDVHLLVTEGLETIACSIRHAALSDNPQYDAVSYVWGDPSPTHHITINGKLLRIPANS